MNEPQNKTNNLSDEELKELDLTKANSSSLQLALDIFSVSQPSTASISQSNSDIGYRRSNRLISLSNMTLDQKRLFDVMFYLAAQNIEENTVYKNYVNKDSRGFYSVQLGFFKWLLQLTNPRNDRLRTLLKNIQKVAFQFEELNLETLDSDNTLEWASYVVFPSINLSISNQLVTFQINTLFEEILQNSHRYNNHHFLSLRHVMPDLPSKQVYDWILSLNNKSTNYRITITVNQFREALNLHNTKTYSKFHELNRRIIQPALIGINANSNLSVEVEPIRNGRKNLITDLVFTIKIIDSHDSEHQKLLRFMRQYQDLQTTFGLQSVHFEEIQKNSEIWTDEHIEQAKKYVLLQMMKGIKIKSIPAYLMNALRNNYKAGELEIAVLEGKPDKVEQIILSQLNTPVAAPQAQSVLTSERNAPPSINNYERQAEQGWELFKNLEPFAQMALIDLFLANSYTKFILQAEKIEITDSNMLFEAILSNPRIHEVFSVFAWGEVNKNA